MTPPGWSQAGRAWLYVLFRKGLVIRNLVSKAVALVLEAVGACAVLCWRIEEHNDGDTTYFTVGESKISNTSPTVGYSFRAGIVRSCPHPASWDRTNVSSMGVVLLQIGPEEDMWTHAARNEFWDLGLPQLNKFSACWKVQQPTPELVAVLRRLLQPIIPDISDDDMKTILELRCVVEADVLDDMIDR